MFLELLAADAACFNFFTSMPESSSRMRVISGCARLLLGTMDCLSVSLHMSTLQPCFVFGSAWLLLGCHPGRLQSTSSQKYSARDWYITRTSWMDPEPLHCTAVAQVPRMRVSTTDKRPAPAPAPRWWAPAKAALDCAFVMQWCCVEHRLQMCPLRVIHVFRIGQEHDTRFYDSPQVLTSKFGRKQATAPHRFAVKTWEPGCPLISISVRSACQRTQTPQKSMIKSARNTVIHCSASPYKLHVQITVRLPARVPTVWLRASPVALSSAPAPRRRTPGCTPPPAAGRADD